MRFLILLTAMATTGLLVYAFTGAAGAGFLFASLAGLATIVSIELVAINNSKDY